MVSNKGPVLEELVRDYFAKQGFYALRGVKIVFENEEVTDIDVWLYGRQSAGIRTRVIVDAKNKKTAKAFERILWTRGLQLALGCDRAIVATTDGSPKAVKFAQQQKVTLLSTKFLAKLEKRLTSSENARLSSEEFTAALQSYPNQKEDGDWLRHVREAKSALISLAPYPAFNATIAAFHFFAERAATRAQHREQALRGALFMASLAATALDSALSQIVYEDASDRSATIERGVTYGDTGDGKVRANIKFVLDVISSGMPNGRAVAMQVEGALGKLFEGVRAEIIAEHFSKEHNASSLFAVARELDEISHARNSKRLSELSIETKSVLGVFADFVDAKRAALFSGGTAADLSTESPASAASNKEDPREEKASPNPSEPDNQGKLL